MSINNLKLEAGNTILGQKQYELDFKYLHGKEGMSALYFIVQRQMGASLMIGLISVLKDHINFCTLSKAKASRL